MSQSAAKHAAERWLTTAREDLESALVLKKAARHAHACFLAQQGAEKAVKALWYRMDEEPWGHSVQRLLQDFAHKATIANVDRCEEHAADLDKFYIPTRYPNGLPDLTPHRVYGARDSEEALRKAQVLVDTVCAWLAARDAGSGG